MLFSLALLPLALSAAEKPNVLLICVDDLKPVVGCYGDAAAKTPSLDRLASRGLRLDRAYCNQAVCSPSRNALMTSLRPQTLGIYDLATNFRKSRPDAITVAQHFKANGYHTEALGKIFHVGHGNGEDEASWTVPPFRPQAAQYLNPGNAAPNTPEAKAKELRGAATESADVPDDTYPDGQIALEAGRRIAAAKEKDEPFFLAVGFLKPHLPFVAPQKYWDLHDPTAGFELYDYEEDPGETKNLADGRPEIVNELRGILATHPEAEPQLISKAPAATPKNTGPSKSGAKDRVAAFKKRDLDKDGKLTLEEFLVNQPDPDEAPKRFPTFDADHDGFLSEMEYVKSGKVTRP